MMTTEQILKKWKEHKAMLALLHKEATGIVDQLERDVLPSRSPRKGKGLTEAQKAKLVANTKKKIVFK